MTPNNSAPDRFCHIDDAGYWAALLATEPDFSPPPPPPRLHDVGPDATLRDLRDAVDAHRDALPSRIGKHDHALLRRVAGGVHLKRSLATSLLHVANDAAPHGGLTSRADAVAALVAAGRAPRTARWHLALLRDGGLVLGPEDRLRLPNYIESFGAPAERATLLGLAARRDRASGAARTRRHRAAHPASRPRGRPPTRQNDAAKTAKKPRDSADIKTCNGWICKKETGRIDATPVPALPKAAAASPVPVPVPDPKSQFTRHAEARMAPDRAPPAPMPEAAGSPLKLAAAVAARNSDALQAAQPRARPAAPRAADAPSCAPGASVAAPGAAASDSGAVPAEYAAVMARFAAKSAAMRQAELPLPGDAPPLPVTPIRSGTPAAAPRAVAPPRAAAPAPRAPQPPRPPPAGSCRRATLRDWETACRFHAWLQADWGRMVLTTGVTPDELRRAIAGTADARQARDRGAVANVPAYLKACCMDAVAARGRR